MVLPDQVVEAVPLMQLWLVSVALVVIPEAGAVVVELLLTVVLLETVVLVAEVKS